MVCKNDPALTRSATLRVNAPCLLHPVVTRRKRRNGFAQRAQGRHSSCPAAVGVRAH